MKYFLSLLISFIIISSISYSIEKRVLLEQYTSANKGVCPDGLVYMDKIMSESQGRVIGINFHEDDDIQLDDGVLTHNFFVPDQTKRFWPSATIQRLEVSDPDFQKYYLVERKNWEFLIDQLLANQSKIEVLLNWKYNLSTKKISGTISCTTIKDYNYQLAFQVIVCENNVSGTGPGFDQVNDYNEYDGHPFYHLGNPVKGFVHNRVARGFIGGLAGNIENLPDTVKTGISYKWDFEYDMPSVPSGAPIKPEDVFLVGVVGQSKVSFIYQVLNCVEAKETKPAIAIYNKDIAFGSTTVGITNEKSITISNTGVEDLSIEGINITGDDESAFKFDEITFPKTVKPGEDFEVLIKFLPKTVKDYSAVLKILSNDVYKPEVSVSLTGTGTSSSVETPTGAICNISISPNPAGDFITVKLGTINPTLKHGVDETFIQIYNTLGEKVMSVGTGRDLSVRINISDLPEGVYFVKAGGETVKFVKM
ncbi:MAG: choice-of-anchor D domain-containing protein [bacterium]